MKFDFHTHHVRCGHAKGEIRDYIEAAIANGLDMIGISDHAPFFAEDVDHALPRTAMAKSAFPEYVAEVLRCKREYAGRIEVLLGVESDYFHGRMEGYCNGFAGVPFDYILGSVHFVGGHSIFDGERLQHLDSAQAKQEKEAYLRAIQHSAQSGLFDILAHIDCMKTNFPAYSEIQTEETDRTLQVIAACDTVIEVNTSGAIKQCHAWHPVEDILERAFHYGVKVTFGSDSHVPSRVGDQFEEVSARLRAIGYREWAVFSQRVRRMVPIAY